MKRNNPPGPEQLALVDVLVWFCNAKIASTAQVESRFQTAAKVQCGPLAPDNVGAYHRDQERARGLLRRIVAFDAAPLEERKALATEVVKFQASKTAMYLRAWMAGDQLRSEWVTTLTGVESALAYAAVLLLSNRNLRRRVGACALEGCPKFFFDDRERGGRRKAYCSQEHSDLGRVTRWRRLQTAKHK